MKATVRPFEPNDLESLIQLHATVAPDSPVVHDPHWYASLWSWLQRHPLGDEMRRWVLATEDGQVVGHLATVSQYYRICGRRVVAHTPYNLVIHPRHAFQTLSLMRTWFRTYQNVVSPDQVEAALQIEMRMGLEPVAKLRYAAKVLDVSRLRTPLPSWLLSPPNWALKAANLALSSQITSRFQVEVLEGFDERFDRFFECVAASIPCTVEKDASFLNWRYGPASPQAPLTVLGVTDGESLLGYAVLRLSSSYGGYLLDLTTLPGRYDVGRALLCGVVRESMRAGMHLIRYRFLESSTAPRRQELWGVGFFYRQVRRHTLLVRFADSELQRVALDASNWSYSIGDGEAGFGMP